MTDGARRLRVAHLIKGLGRGGAESLLPLTVAAGGPGFEYRVGYFLPWKDALVPDLEAAGAPVHGFGTRSNLSLLTSVPRVAGWLRRERVGLVHGHLPLAGVVARLAGRLAGVPVVYTEHNLQERYHPGTRLANRLTWRAQAQAIAVSGEVARSIGRSLGDRVPVTVVRNGIAVGGPRPSEGEVSDLRRDLGILAGAPVIGSVAVLRTQKRFDHWLRAARLVASERPDAHFVLVGDGPLRGQLEALARELGLAGQVTFAGLREDVAPYLALFDVYLMSSEFEGLPLALLEAMAAGVPPVATAVGGIPEVVRDRVEGRLVPFGDVEGLARGAAELLADRDLAASLAAAARRRVEKEFSVERMARELEGIYERVLARGR